MTLLDLLESLLQIALEIPAVGIILPITAWVVFIAFEDIIKQIPLGDITLGDIIKRLQPEDNQDNQITQGITYNKAVDLLCEWKAHLEWHYKVGVDVTELFTSWFDYEKYADEHKVSTEKADELLTILVQDLFKLTENIDDYYSSGVLETEINKTYAVVSTMFIDKLQELKDAMQVQEDESKKHLKNKYEYELVALEKSIHALVKKV